MKKSTKRFLFFVGASAAAIYAYNKYIETLKPKYRERQYSTMQSIIEMHKAPKSDVYEALKNERMIYDKIAPLGGDLLVSPILN